MNRASNLTTRSSLQQGQPERLHATPGGGASPSPLLALPLLALLGLAGFGAPMAHADNLETPRFDARSERQQQRLEAGAESGQLTEREQRRLGWEQQQLQSMQERLAADGTLTRNERARMQYRQNQASRDLYWQKHDRQH